MLSLHMTSHDIMYSLPTHPYCAAWESPLALSVTYWLWLRLKKLERTERTWMGFPSTLMLQLFFVRKIKDRIRAEEASLVLRSIFFLPETQLSVLYVILCLCACASLCVMQCLGNAAAFQFSLSLNVAASSQHTDAHTSTRCAYDIQYASVSTPTLAPTYTTHTYARAHHPACWSVTMETECLPNRGCDGGSRREEEVCSPLFIHVIHELMNQSATQQNWTDRHFLRM